MESLKDQVQASLGRLGGQIEQLVKENERLQQTVYRYQDELKAAKIRYRADVLALRDDNASLEAILCEFKGIIEELAGDKGEKLKTQRYTGGSHASAGLTELDGCNGFEKKRKIDAGVERSKSPENLRMVASEAIFSIMNGSPSKRFPNKSPGNSPLKSSMKFLTKSPRKPPTKSCSRRKESSGQSPPNNASFPDQKLLPLKQFNRHEVVMYQGNPLNKEDFTDSQFNKLPTQYSSQDSSIPPESMKPETNEMVEMSPLKNEGYLSEEIEDSQDEFGPMNIKLSSSPVKRSRVPFKDKTNLANEYQTIKKEILIPLSSQSTTTKNHQIPEIPPNCTKLQRRSVMITYYLKKLQDDPNFKINLVENPITESRWIISDFKVNPRYQRPYDSTKMGICNAERTKIQRLHQMAGPLKRKTMISWNGQEDEDDEDYSLSESQFFDKLPSPPGFMVSEFPDTQEQKQRDRLVDERQQDRIRRRLKQCISRSKGRNGEFIFQLDVLNSFVDQGRYII